MHYSVLCTVCTSYSISITLSVSVYTDDQEVEWADVGLTMTEHCTQWKDIGAQLGLKPAVLRNAGADLPNNNKECFRKTLESWMQMEKATWGKLELAITNVNRQNLGLPKLTSSKQLCNN